MLEPTDRGRFDTYLSGLYNFCRVIYQDYITSVGLVSSVTSEDTVPRHRHRYARTHARRQAHTHARTHAREYTRTHTRTYIYTHTYTPTHIQPHTNTPTLTHTRASTLMHARTHSRTHITHTHARTDTHACAIRAFYINIAICVLHCIGPSICIPYIACWCTG